MASIGVVWWTHVVQSETENGELERENEREEYDELFATFSLLRIVDLMSPWHSAG